MKSLLYYLTGKEPAPLQITQDQLGVNLADKNFYMKDLNGNVIPFIFEDRLPATDSEGRVLMSNSSYDKVWVEQTTGLKNRLINGTFKIWQRGEITVNPNNGSMVSDRWKLSADVTSPCTFSKVILEDGTEGIRFTRPSGGQASSWFGIEQRLEEPHLYSNKTFTLSAKMSTSNTTGNCLFAPQIIVNFGTGGSTRLSVHSLANKPVVDAIHQKYQTTFTFPDLSDKIFGVGAFLQIYFNGIGNATPVVFFDTSQVQFEENVIATKFEDRDYGLELSLCQRYYYSYPRTFIDTVGATYNNLSTIRYAYHIRVDYPVQMRVSPTTSWVVDVGSTAIDVSSSFSKSISNGNSFGIQNAVSAFTSGAGLSLTFTASAEL